MAQKVAIQNLVVKQWGVGKSKGILTATFITTFVVHTVGIQFAKKRLWRKNAWMKPCARIQDMCPLQNLRKVFLQHTELNGDIWNSLKALRGWHKSWSSSAFSHQHLLPLPHSPSRQVCFLSLGRSAGQCGKGALPNYCYRWFSFSKGSWRPLKNRSFKMLKAIWWWHVKK